MSGERAPANRAELIEIAGDAILHSGRPAPSSRTIARAVLAALEAAGVRLVPAEATREMWAAGGNAAVGKTTIHHDAVVSSVWDGMCAASPYAPEGGR